MPLIGIPNLSVARDAERVGSLRQVLEEARATVLDTHSDRAHNRSVFTVTADPADLPDAFASLARATVPIDLRDHDGLHPRTGVFDVCPIVPHHAGMSEAIEVARATGEAIAAAGLPVYLYAHSATRTETRSLPDIRRGGLAGVIRRANQGLTPDLGPSTIDPRRGVVCVGARDVLIAFNVWLRAGIATAERIAAAVRETGGGLAGVRALGLEVDPDVAQVSMNLTQPSRVGVDETFTEVDRLVRLEGGGIVATELVGLVPKRFEPDPHGEAARLLLE
ncbi:MAG: glutamate formiminotransferase, partial [Actinomycetota bacterium]|nr:glutamate formiminotransferase [Actinomycetota bacterium]